MREHRKTWDQVRAAQESFSFSLFKNLYLFIVSLYVKRIKSFVHIRLPAGLWDVNKHFKLSGCSRFICVSWPRRSLVFVSSERCGDVILHTADASRQTLALIWCFSLEQLQLCAGMETETICQPHCWPLPVNYLRFICDFFFFPLTQTLKHLRCCSWTSTSFVHLARPVLSNSSTHFLIIFSSFSLISWQNKPVDNLLLLFYPSFHSSRLPAFISFRFFHPCCVPYLSFHSALTLEPVRSDLLCNYGVNMLENHSGQLLRLPGLHLHCDSEVN